MYHNSVIILGQISVEIAQFVIHFQKILFFC